VHIVTKILMIFCAVLSLVLAALTMAYASNAGALKASINAEKNAASAARTAANAQLAEHSAELVSQSTRIQTMVSEQSQAQSKIANLQSDNTNLRSQVTQAQADAQSAMNQLSGYQATVQTQAKLIAQYRDEVTNLRNSMLETEKRNIELTDKINDLTSAREVLEQNARALKEQLEETKLSLQASQQAGGTVGGAGTMVGSIAAAHELPGPLVRAHVTETFKSASGDDMVVINEGSNRGLKENVKMNVTRQDGTFVASIVLMTIEPTRAVGKVTTTRAGSVQTGDMVLSRLD
jgi:hypothetical protein